MKKGIIFDVDGTLWDSAVQVAEAWSQASSAFEGVKGAIAPETVYANMGRTMKEFADILFPQLPEKERMSVMDVCMEYENQYLETHPGTLYPNVYEVLRQLSWQYNLYIVSNCQRGYIEILMKAYGLEEYINDIECYGSTGLQKGDNIRLVLERNHVERCIYVGDTAMDQEAAHYAGVPFVFAAYGFGNVEGALAKIDTFEELLTVAKNLLGDTERAEG